MKTVKIILSLLLILSISSSQATIEEIEKLALTMPEAQLLIETRGYLRGLNELNKKGTKINRKEALALAAELEEIGIHGSECAELERESMLGAQAYALAAGIYGILSKENKDISLGKKSYNHLIKARELDPDNTDAIKGQAVALNMILAKGWVLSRVAALALGINLVAAQKELIEDLREFPERKDFQLLADKLEDKL